MVLHCSLNPGGQMSTMEKTLTSIDSRLAQLLKLLSARASTAEQALPGDSHEYVPADIDPTPPLVDVERMPDINKVRSVLVALNNRRPNEGTKILRTVGGVISLVELPPNKFQAV